MSTKHLDKTLLIHHPGTEQVALVIAILLDPLHLDIEETLSALVPEMAKGGVKSGLLVVGDSTLILRASSQEMLIDEVGTDELLSLANIDDSWHQDSIVQHMEEWVSVMSKQWRDRLVGPLRDLLVPHIVAYLAGEVTRCDGIWGMEAHRVATIH